VLVIRAQVLAIRVRVSSIFFYNILLEEGRLSAQL
jgi:hypothetical protein